EHDVQDALGDLQLVHAALYAGTNSCDRTTCMPMASRSQAPRHMPHPMHLSSSTTAKLPSSIIVIASKMHRSTHLSHPLQRSESITARKRLGDANFPTPVRNEVQLMQQSLQQLQITWPTPCLFSATCTRPWSSHISSM